MSMVRLEQRGDSSIFHVKDLGQANFVRAVRIASEHVVVESFRPIPSALWTSINIQLTPKMDAAALSVRGMRLDMRLSKEQFGEMYPLWIVGGLHAWFLDRPCPDTLEILSLPEDRRYRVLSSLGFTLELLWPQPAISDWARFATNQDDVRQQLATIFRSQKEVDEGT